MGRPRAGNCSWGTVSKCRRTRIVRVELKTRALQGPSHLEIERERGFIFRWKSYYVLITQPLLKLVPRDRMRSPSRFSPLTSVRSAITSVKMHKVSGKFHPFRRNTKNLKPLPQNENFICAVPPIIFMWNTGALSWFRTVY